MKRYLLFDLDRTLWDFDGNAELTFRAMFAEFRIDERCHTDYETFHERYRVINDTLWEAYRNGTLGKEALALSRFTLTLEAFGLGRNELETIRLGHRMSDYYVLKGPLQTGLMPGAREMLEALSQRRDRWQLGVITNGFSEAQIPKMRTAGIDGYFDWFFLSETLGFMKPDRRFFDAALAEMGASAEECLVVGDDYQVDIAGAMTAGIEQIYYNLKDRQLPAGAAKPTYEIHHLPELVAIVDKL